MPEARATASSRPSLPDRLGQLLLPASFAAAAVLAYAGGGFQLGQWGPFALAFALVAAAVLAIVPMERERFGGRLRVVALAALAAYVAWSAITIAWSPNQFSAHEEVARTALYAACVIVGVAGSRWRSAVQTSIVVWVIATCAVAAVMLRQLAAHQDHFFAGGRLLGTLTYHNAEAALLVMPIPAALSVAALRQVDVEVRTLLVAGSAFLAMVAVLPQSRGSMLGLAVAMVVTAIVSPARTRLALVSVPVVAAVALAWPRLNAVYTARQAHPQESAAQQIDAATSMVVGLTAIVVVAVLVATLLDRAREAPRAARRATSVVVALACIALVVGALAASPKLRSPVHTVRSEWNAAVENHPTETGDDLADTGRFAQLGNGSAAARIELWKVALHDFERERLHGIGASQYEATFYRERSQMLDRYARQPHQLTLEVLAERGIVGALLLATVIACIVATAVRARLRSRSQRSKALVAGLLGTCAYWLAHAQLDWIWQMGALTVPAALAAGCLLGAPWHLPSTRRALRRPGRSLLVACMLVVAVVTVPLVIAQRHVARASEELVDGNADAALEEARTATRWAPYWADAWQQRADAYEALGDESQAVAAARRSARQDPEHWAAWVWLADFHDRVGNDDEAIDARLRANELNPLDPDLALPESG